MLRHCGTITITTNRLSLSPFKLTDAADMYHNWASDPEVTRYLTWRAHKNQKVTEDLLAYICAHYTLSTYNWAIRLKTDGVAIGNICVTKLNPIESSAEIAYALSRFHWGEGIVSEAMEAVFELLFVQVGCKCIIGRHDVENTPSAKVMERIGMTKGNLFLLAGNDNIGRPVDLQEWYMTADQWNCR